MTILWDPDPQASDRFRFALGGDTEQCETIQRVVRSLEEDPSHALIAIGPDVDLDAACELAERQRVERPHLGIILIRGRVDVNVLTQALRAGVREVVSGTDQNTLADAVRRSLTLTAQIAGRGAAVSGGPDGRIVTVFSAKGGVGKTMVATNLAAYLAATGAKTLLVDLDLMFGDDAICLQLMPRGSIMDAVQMAGGIDLQGVQSIVTRHESSGLDVMAAPEDPADADRVPPEVITELLRVARSNYHYVIIDTPPAFTAHVLAALDVSDLTLLVATLDIPTVKNLRIALNTLDALGLEKDSRNVVLNRADAKVGITQPDVEAALRYPVTVGIPASASVPTSTNRGVPIVLDEPRSPVSLALRTIADELIRGKFAVAVDEPALRRMMPRRRK